MRVPAALSKPRRSWPSPPARVRADSDYQSQTERGGSGRRKQALSIREAGARAVRARVRLLDAGLQVDATVKKGCADSRTASFAVLPRGRTTRGRCCAAPVLSTQHCLRWWAWKPPYAGGRGSPALA